MMAKHFLVQAETQLNDGDSSAMLSNNRKVTYTDGKKSVAGSARLHQRSRAGAGCVERALRQPVRHLSA